MANPHRGEFEFEAAGEKYILRFSANAVVDLEEAFDVTLGQLGERFQSLDAVRLADIRTMFCVGLEDKHRDLTKDQRIKLFGELLPMEATQLVMQAFQRSFGVSEVVVAENPPKPGNPPSGTGPASTETGVG